MSDVPMDIVTAILRRLPVKPLLRFRLVCKPWRALIDSPNFAKSHLVQSLQTNTNRSLVLQFGSLCSLELDSLDTAVKLAHPIELDVDSFCWPAILGSCHGLLLLIWKDKFVLWNPSTRWLKKLPSSGFLRHTDYLGNHFFLDGFGYDRVNGDYKVIVISLFYHEASRSFGSKVRVYSSRTNSWRITRKFPYNIARIKDDMHGVLANGALHWAVSVSDDADLITAFDLVSEEFHLVPQPQDAENGLDMNVGVLGDRLCMHYYDDQQFFVVWVMNEYGVKDSWTKLLSISQRDDYIGSLECLEPIAYSRSGLQVLFGISGYPLHSSGGTTFFWYDLEKKIVKPIKINGAHNYFRAFICIESLVRLKGGGKPPAKMQPALEKRRSLKKPIRDLYVEQKPGDSSSGYSLPSYMQATESSKAKALAANSSPSSSPDVHDKEIYIKKRHSLPGTNGWQGSPRIQHSMSQAQQSTKGSTTHERKWQR